MSRFLLGVAAGVVLAGAVWVARRVWGDGDDQAVAG